MRLAASLQSLLLATLALPFAAPAQTDSGLLALGKAVPGRYIVTYAEGAIPSDAEARTAMAGARLLHRHTRLGFTVVESVFGPATHATALLQAQPGVLSVVQDRIVSAHDTNAHNSAPAQLNLALTAESWAVRQAGGYGAPGGAAGPWSVTRGAGVRIAVLDSGLDAAHPNLEPNLAVNLSEVDQAALPSPCDDGSPQDQEGHGSWTASLAAGAALPGGVGTGVAPAATLLNIKVLERMPGDGVHASTCAAGEAAGLLSWVLQGLEDAIAQHADIVTMSLGTLVDITTGDGAGLKATFDHATHAAALAGIVLIAAAGNDGLNLAGSHYVELPAQSRDVLAIVAATNPACAEDLRTGALCAPGPVTLPYYSNYGAPLNALAAPGGSYPEGPATDPTVVTGWIYGACSQGKPGTADGLPSDANHSFGCFGLGHTAYVQAMGTSAAAPLAAGAAALLRAAHPEWDAATLVAALRSGATPVAGLPVPMINVAASLAAAANGQHGSATGAR